jgi:hypothetical protein
MSTCQIITCPDVELSIRSRNGKEEKHYLTNGLFELLPGWQIIEIPHNGSTPYEITDVKINGQSLRELLYLAWFTKPSGEKLQPGNILTDMPGKWSIILHSDISVLKERVCNQITNGDYGTNLFEKYQWFLDLAEPLEKSIKPQIDAFMERSQGLNLYPKKEYQWWPFISLNIPVDDSIQEDLKLMTFGRRPSPPHYNWGYLDIMSKDDPNEFCRSIDQLPLPNCVKWLSGLGITSWTTIKSFVLYEHGYIDLHRDFDNTNFNNTTVLFDPTKGLPDKGFGIRHLHIPINNNEKITLKLSGGTLMPKTVNLLNNGGYSHSGFNLSNNVRYAVVINHEWTTEFVEKYIIPTDIYSNLEL